MTDTARTLAELKTLLADNATQAISAQDLRDAIESVAVPIEGSGFGSIGAGFDQVFFGDAIGGGSSPTIATATNYRLPFVHSAQDVVDGYFFDPQGWLQSTALDPAFAFPLPVPAYSYLLLPAGTYVFSGWVQWDSGFTSGDSWCIVGQPIDPRIATAGVDPLWDPVYMVSWPLTGGVQSSAAFPAVGKSHQGATILRVPRATAPVAVAGMYVRQTSGSDRTLEFAAVSCGRIGDGG